MSNEKMEVDGSARVAYDLMKSIAANEKDNKERQENPRKYYLRLYEQSIAIVRGTSSEYILKD
ncbi:hypothetical protein [Marinobacter sp. SS13-12]|uniref:hypothetical protein n=1 Tax=Marinobacter sp. SS13-12 TaxID=3050451 RepID=UPI002554BA38|nr:hypothetical protein [Marinobacter sp. SS13-12]MDK8463084.1 hypothetical protein [Marinobacter sp. SS13-12]